MTHMLEQLRAAQALLTEALHHESESVRLAQANEPQASQRAHAMAVDAAKRLREAVDALPVNSDGRMWRHHVAPCGCKLFKTIVTDAGGTPLRYVRWLDPVRSVMEHDGDVVPMAGHIVSCEEHGQWWPAAPKADTPIATQDDALAGMGRAFIEVLRSRGVRVEDILGVKIDASVTMPPCPEYVPLTLTFADPQDDAPAPSPARKSFADLLQDEAVKRTVRENVLRYDVSSAMTLHQLAARDDIGSPS